jgi:hypothetical protein
LKLNTFIIPLFQKNAIVFAGGKEEFLNLFVENCNLLEGVI